MVTVLMSNSDLFNHSGLSGSIDFDSTIQPTPPEIQDKAFNQAELNRQKKREKNLRIKERGRFK
jgi:hypothetical protein